MDTVLVELVKSLGGTAMLTLALAYLAKKFTEQSLSKDIERHKAELNRDLETFKTNLKAAADLEAERLKNDLRRVSFEHETRFRLLHEEIAKVISETYPLLHDLYDAVRSYVNPVDFGFPLGTDPKEEKRKIVAESWQKLDEYFLKRRIYFPKPLYNQIKEVRDLLTNTALEFQKGKRREERGVFDTENDFWIDCWNKIQEKAEPLFDNMCDTFQLALGFPSEGGGRKEDIPNA